MCTPLYLAVYESNLETLSSLLASVVSDQFCSGIHVRSARGWTALDAAAYMKRIDAMRVLLSFTAEDELLLDLTELDHSATIFHARVSIRKL